MKNTTHELTRLLKSAAAAPEREVGAPSIGLENCTITQWRLARPVELIDWPGLLFQRAMACAIAVVVLAFVWTYRELSEPPPSHAAVAEYEMQLSFVP